jgi:hypothetical protein
VVQSFGRWIGELEQRELLADVAANRMAVISAGGARSTSDVMPVSGLSFSTQHRKRAATTQFRIWSPARRISMPYA